MRVDDPDAEPFRYLRLREPPYSDDDLRSVAATLRDPAYVYVRHEDEPTAPETAERLRSLALVRGSGAGAREMRAGSEDVGAPGRRRSEARRRS